ncbi:MAG: PilX N-terminal domain-containing pilus assembly protein [Burkholderiales bacterium]|nr:PilX N-terminal domain-containing pilus assembly protein [Burkholderiales bacterium]
MSRSPDIQVLAAARMPHIQWPCRPVVSRTLHRQHGVTLVVGLLLLALLSLLGLAAMGTGILESRMAANARDRIRALEMAELALQFCENRINPLGNFDGTDGMYSTANLPAAFDWGSHAIAYDQAVPLISEPPRCFVVRLDTVLNEQAPTSESLRLGQAVEGARTYHHYRVSARGSGINDRTVVVLQTHVRRRAE